MGLERGTMSRMRLMGLTCRRSLLGELVGCRSLDKETASRFVLSSLPEKEGPP
jgi:hypothetical protein